MPICLLTPDNWCERHKAYHGGRLRELSQMENNLGESYRDLWDRQASPNGDLPKLRRRTDCIHLGPLIEKGVGCGQQDLYQCAVHGKCALSPCYHHAFCMAGLPESCQRYERWSNLTRYFERVVLINLKRRPERLESVKKELAEKHWPFAQPIIFEAIDGNKVPTPPGWEQGGGAWGCMASHRAVLQDALMHDIHSILVLEDDLALRDTFAADVAKFLADVPDDWDQLMLGGQHMTPPDGVKPGVLKCRNTQRTHAYAVRGRYLRDLYAMWCSPHSSVHCDWLMGGFQKDYTVYAPNPFLVGQGRFDSDICGRKQPKRFWEPAKGDEPIILLRCPKEILPALREKGMHTGYQRDPVTDIDVGLRDLFDGKKAPAFIRAGMAKWIQELQGEVVSEDDMVLAVWHPEATAELIRGCWKGKVIEAEGDTIESILAACGHGN